MATTKRDKRSVAAEKLLKRQKNQAGREAKLVIEIEVAKKDLKKAQRKQSKALAHLEQQNNALRNLQARLEELRANSSQAATDAETTSLPGEEAALSEVQVVMIDAAKMEVFW